VPKPKPSAGGLWEQSATAAAVTGAHTAAADKLCFAGWVPAELLRPEHRQGRRAAARAIGAAARLIALHNAEPGRRPRKCRRP